MSIVIFRGLYHKLSDDVPVIPSTLPTLLAQRSVPSSDFEGEPLLTIDVDANMLRGATVDSSRSCCKCLTVSERM